MRHKPNGGLTLFDPKTETGSSPKTIGTATYTRRTVNGVPVLIINAPAPENEPGDLILFAVKDGQVYGGSFRSKTAKADTQPVFNKIMANAILRAGSKLDVLN